MFGHRFSLVGVDTGLSVDLVKLMFQAVSILIHGVVNAVIDRWVLVTFFRERKVGEQGERGRGRAG